jgi:hypothetical protein
MATNSDFTVSIAVTDNVGVASVSFYVDGSGDPSRLGTPIASTAGNAALSSGTPQSGTWTYSSHFPSGLTCGRYTVRVTAKDAAGNSTGVVAAREIDIVTCTA